MIYRKIEPKRPTVIRKGDHVKTCYYYAGTKECLGVFCFWQRVGTCSILKRIMKNSNNSNSKNNKNSNNLNNKKPKKKIIRKK